MSSMAVEMPLSKLCGPPACPLRDSDNAYPVTSRPSEPTKEVDSVEDIGATASQPSSPGNQGTKKKGFSLKKTAKTVVNGITRKKKGHGEERSKSQDDLSEDIGDQAGAGKANLKSSAINKMFTSFPNPSHKLNKVWNSLNKTFSSSGNENEFKHLSGARSTMTLGRFFGKKRDEVPPSEDVRKAHTLGRLFNFKSRPTPEEPASSAPPTIDDN